jgi:hypothetical protein
MKLVQTVAERFDRIVDVYSAIPIDGSISMLTGSNGSGKSLIRRQLNFRDELRNRTGNKVVHVSMSLRTQDHGVYNVFYRDTDWYPTSVNTINLIDAASKSVHGGYLVLDEIEVGCSEETLMGIVAWLNENLRQRVKDTTVGCMVITHSRYVVEHLKFDHWFNLDGYETPEEWINRKVVPVDLEKLRKDSHALFQLVTASGEKKKAKK